MSRELKSPDQFQTLFSGSLQGISPCWEPSEWSQVYRLDLRDGTRLFLKRIPRSRNEALVTQHLHELCPRCVPVLWEAYEQGWGRPISQPYREACALASAIADLVIDQAIVESVGQGPAHLPGLIPGLRDLEDLIAKPPSH